MNSYSNDEHDDVRTTERIIEVYPPDYVALKKQVMDDSKKISELQDKCRSLEHFLTFCDISPMTHIIHDYKSMSDFYIAQLAKEIEIYRFSENERSEILAFLDYLRSITGEIEDMLSVKH